MDTGLVGEACHYSCAGLDNSWKMAHDLLFQLSISIHIYSFGRFCSRLIFPVKDNIKTNKFHKALTFFKKSKKTKTRSMTVFSENAPTRPQWGGKQKVTFAPVFTEKETPERFLEAFTTFLLLRDWLTSKNSLEQNTALTISHVSQQAPTTTFMLLSMSFGLPTCQTSCSPIFKSLYLLWYQQLIKENRLLIGNQDVHIINLLIQL